LLVVHMQDMHHHQQAADGQRPDGEAVNGPAASDGPSGLLAVVGLKLFVLMPGSVRLD